MNARQAVVAALLVVGCSAGPGGGTGGGSAVGGGSGAVGGGTASSGGGSGTGGGGAAMGGGGAMGGGSATGGGAATGGGSTGPDASRKCTLLSAPPTMDVGTYSNPAPASLPSGTTFATDWDQQADNGGWQWLQIINSCRMHPDSTFQTWHGKTAVRIEVNPHDDPIALGVNTERAEAAQMQSSGGDISETSASGTKYYALSYYFPSTWSGTQYGWSAFEASGTTWPAGSVADCSADDSKCASWSFVMQLYGWGALGAASRAPGAPQTYNLDVGNTSVTFAHPNLSLGHWSDFVISVNWATGATVVWRRDEGQTAFTMEGSATGGAPSQTIYFKQGLYRGGAVNGRTDVYWAGPTARGATFSAVEQAAFGTNVGP